MYLPVDKALGLISGYIESSKSNTEEERLRTNALRTLESEIRRAASPEDVARILVTLQQIPITKRASFFAATSTKLLSDDLDPKKQIDSRVKPIELKLPKTGFQLSYTQNTVAWATGSQNFDGLLLDLHQETMDCYQSFYSEKSLAENDHVNEIVSAVNKDFDDSLKNYNAIGDFERDVVLEGDKAFITKSNKPDIIKQKIELFLVCAEVKKQEPNKSLDSIVKELQAKDKLNEGLQHFAEQDPSLVVNQAQEQYNSLVKKIAPFKNFFAKAAGQFLNGATYKEISQNIHHKDHNSDEPPIFGRGISGSISWHIGEQGQIYVDVVNHAKEFSRQAMQDPNNPECLGSHRMNKKGELRRLTPEEFNSRPTDDDPDLAAASTRFELIHSNNKQGFELKPIAMTSRVYSDQLTYINPPERAHQSERGVTPSSGK